VVGEGFAAGLKPRPSSAKPKKSQALSAAKDLHSFVNVDLKNNCRFFASLRMTDFQPWLAQSTALRLSWIAASQTGASQAIFCT